MRPSLLVLVALLVLSSLVVLPQPAQASHVSVEFDAADTFLEPFGNSDFSFSYTVTSEQDRVLIVSVMSLTTDDPPPVAPTVTYAGREMVLLEENNDAVGQNHYLFYQRNPNTGANDIAVNDVGGVGVQSTTVGVLSFFNAAPVPSPARMYDSGEADFIGGSFFVTITDAPLVPSNGILVSLLRYGLDGGIPAAIEIDGTQRYDDGGAGWDFYTAQTGSSEWQIGCGGGGCDFGTDFFAGNALVLNPVGHGGAGGGGPAPIQASPQDFTIACSTGTFTDVRPQAANAILYVWNFGDGTQETTALGKVSHVYVPGTYTVTVSVQDRSGAIQQFYFTVETGISCSIGQFIGTYLLPFLGVLLLVAIAGLTVFSKYVPSKVKVWLKRIFVFGGIAFVLMLMFDLQWLGR